jgi:hypothetical protein
MQTLGILALSAGEVAFFAPPPRPPQRRAGRSVEGGGIGRLIRLVRRELAGATMRSPVDSVPRLRNYPY